MAARPPWPPPGSLGRTVAEDDYGVYTFEDQADGGVYPEEPVEEPEPASALPAGGASSSSWNPPTELPHTDEPSGLRRESGYSDRPFVPSLPRAFAGLPDEKKPNIFNSSHDVPEDLRRAFAAQPGKEYTGEPTPLEILSERLRGVTLDFLEAGGVEALECFAGPAREFRKAYSHWGAVPTQGEKGGGGGTQEDAGNQVYPLAVQVIRHMAEADNQKLTLEVSNPELVADHVEAVLGVGMAQGGGQYGGLADKWPVDAWKLSREEPNQQIASKLMKVVSAVTDMCTQLPFNVEKKDRTAERFATVSSRWAANALEGFPQDATPNLATFIASRRGSRGQAAPGKRARKASAESVLRKKNRDKRRGR